MALVEDQDGLGSSFSYIFQCFAICYNPESLPYRKDCFLLSSAVLLFTLCLLQRAISNF